MRPINSLIAERDLITGKPLPEVNANAIRSELCRQRRQIADGNDSELWIWVFRDQLACAQRPLRDDPIYGGRRPLPEKAQPLVEAWVERVVASGFRSIISLLEVAQIERYYARGGMKLHKNGLLASTGPLACV